MRRFSAAMSDRYCADAFLSFAVAARSSLRASRMISALRAAAMFDKFCSFSDIFPWPLRRCCEGYQRKKPVMLCGRHRLQGRVSEEDKEVKPHTQMIQERDRAAILLSDRNHHFFGLRLW
jgi:hypothetical protein